MNGVQDTMKRKSAGWLVMCVLLCMLFFEAGAEREIPDSLRVTQEIEIRKLSNYRIITTSVLHSARADVNDAINARVTALAEEAEPLVPRGKDFNTRPARADICTQITRTGSRWMSFHIYAGISVNNNQQWVKSEEYTYEMESGRLIRLGEIIREDGWETLIREIRTQAEDSFPEDAPDENALDAICCRESLENTGFVIAPGHLALYFPAAEIYPAHAEALLRVEIYVPERWEILTEEARRETDCTGYDMIALTYDDGPAKGTTRDVLNASVCHPGQVTFFPIGYRLEKNAELLHREFDAGHSVQSHTWAHSIEGVTQKKTARWEERFNLTMGGIIGRVPVMMRPPGGRYGMYTAAGCEMPMILWSVNSVDADESIGDSRSDMIHCSSCALGAQDGDIVLFHDARSFAGDLAEKCMERFEERNVLLVTVNDLCALRGIRIETGTGLVLRNCPTEGRE